MEFIQALVMLILAIGFNGGQFPTDASKVYDEEVIKALFSGDNEYSGFIESEEGIIFNPIYQNASGPANTPTNQPQAQELIQDDNYFDDDEGPSQQAGGYWYYAEDPDNPENNSWKYVPPFGDY